MTDLREPSDDAADEIEVTGRSHRARNAALAVGAVLVLLIVVLATSKPPEDPPNPLVNRSVPALAGPTLDGRHLDIDNLRGKWVVVNFLASWCVGCVQEHPDLVRFAEQHRDDAQVVGVAYNDDPETLREFFRTRGGDWPVILPERTTAVDFGVTAVPETFVVAPSGLVVAWAEGVTLDWLNAVLAANRPGPAPR